MATVSKRIAVQIIAADGYFHDDPRVQQVVRYTTLEGVHAYAVLYEADVRRDRYAPSVFVRDPVVIWQAK